MPDNIDAQIEALRASPEYNSKDGVVRQPAVSEMQRLYQAKYGDRPAPSAFSSAAEADPKEEPKEDAIPESELREDGKDSPEQDDKSGWTLDEIEADKSTEVLRRLWGVDKDETEVRIDKIVATVEAVDAYLGNRELSLLIEEAGLQNDARLAATFYRLATDPKAPCTLDTLTPAEAQRYIHALQKTSAYRKGGKLKKIVLEPMEDLYKLAYPEPREAE